MYERLMDKSTQPTDADMLKAIGQPIGKTWTSLQEFLVVTYGITPIFNSGGKKYGWNLQYRLGGRPLCELYPEHGSFTALVILGKNELVVALGRIDTFGETISRALEESPRYHDGCWMYIRITNPETCQQDVQDIEQLILIKKKPPKKVLNHQ